MNKNDVRSTADYEHIVFPSIIFQSISIHYVLVFLRANRRGVFQSSVCYIVYNRCGGARVFQSGSFNFGLQSSKLLRTFKTLLCVHQLIVQIYQILDIRVLIWNVIVLYCCLFIIKFYRDLILEITKFQWISFTISVVCLVILIVTREVLQTQLNKLKWYPKVPAPIPLFLVCHLNFVKSHFEYWFSDIELIS